MTLHDVYYHNKPYLLTLGGIFCMVTGSNPVIIGGGVILTLAGLAIWKMRRR